MSRNPGTHFSSIVRLLAVAALLAGLPLPAARAQERGTTVPRLMKHSGQVNKSVRAPIVAGGEADTMAAAPARATASATFAIYAEAEGGAALWQETQNVALDAAGQYSVLLGAASREGLPAGLFASGEPRWLAVRLNEPGDAEASGEQARVLLVSVPYALRAADAETLGGRPATDFLLREELAGWSGVGALLAAPQPGAPDRPRAVGGTQGTITATGNVGFLPRLSALDTPAPGDVTYSNSLLFDNGTNMGIGTTTPVALLDLQLTTAAPRDTLSAAVTLNNSLPVLGSVVTPFRMTLTDQSTDTNLSKQAMRVIYNRDTGASGNVTAFDSAITLASFFRSSAPYTYRVLNVEGPRVFPGMSLTTLFGIFIEAPPGMVGGQPAGTVSNKFAMVAAPGSGNVGIGTTAPTHLLEVSGGNIKITGAGHGLVFPDGTMVTTASSVPGAGGGDITAVNAGAGLEGGGIAGDVTLSLLTSCSSNQLLKWTGSAWGCAPEGNGGGTVTSVTGGAGLTGGAITGSGTLAVDTAAIQARIGNCPAGESIRAIAPDGAVTCEVDNDSGTITAVNAAAGSGLTGGATSGNADLSLLTTCADGQVLKFATGGAGWGCAADNNSGGTVTSVATSTGVSGGPIASNGTVSLDTVFTDGRYARPTVSNTMSGQNTYTGATSYTTTVNASPPSAAALGPIQITHVVPDTGTSTASMNLLTSCPACGAVNIWGYNVFVTLTSASNSALVARGFDVTVNKTVAGPPAAAIGARGFVTGPNGTGVDGQGPNVGVSGLATDASVGIGARGRGALIGVQAYSTGALGTAAEFTVEQATGSIIRGFQGTLGGSVTEVFRVEGDGDVFANGSYNCGKASACFNAGAGADLAERIDVTEPLLPGDVVELDPDTPAHFRKVRGALSTMVAGIVSTQPAVTLANNDLAGNQTGKRTDTRPLLALAGRVPVKVTDEAGPIQPGDMLVSSSTPGHAMRCAEGRACIGAVLGKALAPHARGAGTVMTLVTLQ